MKNSTLHPLYPAAQNAPAEMSLSKQRLRVWLRMLDRNRNFLNRLRASLRDDFETTLPRFDVMATLSWHEEGLRMSALSTHMKVSNGNVTGIVESLIREGLVLRKVAPDDKRAATVSLTSLAINAFSKWRWRMKNGSMACLPISTANSLICLPVCWNSWGKMRNDRDERYAADPF
jgi:DNA-binding MarR family transcriptional regulator